MPEDEIFYCADLCKEKFGIEVEPQLATIMFMLVNQRGFTNSSLIMRTISVPSAQIVPFVYKAIDSHYLYTTDTIQMDWRIY